MIFSLFLMMMGAVFGIVIGGIQGYLGGTVDIIVQRLIEIWSSLPFLIVVILVGSVYGRSFILLLLVMALFQWIGLSYYMRGEFLRLKNMTYVSAAKALGIKTRSIFFRQIFPNALIPVITIMPFSLIGGITALTALDFLGFGLPPPSPSWGEMLSQGLVNLYAPWITISTVAALFTTLLLATFIGEGVREAFDPRSEYRFE
jgi:microcin C transport system permease protein